MEKIVAFILLGITDERWFRVVGFCLLALILLVILAYVISLNHSVIQSSLVSQTNFNEGSHFYYLPTAEMNLRVTAVVRISYQNQSNDVQNVELTELKFLPKIHICPDLAKVVAVKYQSNPFANDEILISNSADGLLENCKVVTEDRITEIVTQITTATTYLRDSSNIASLTNINAELPHSYREVEFTRHFYVGSEELYSGSINRKWDLSITDQFKIDAGFTLNSPASNTNKSAYKNAPFNGLFTRPMVSKTWAYNGHNTNTQFRIEVPCDCSILKIPIQRSLFVRKTQIPKFYKGLLQEINISKPSEFEQLVSIPISIAKAVISIPAQIFQFRINLLNQQLESAKAEMELQQLLQKTKERRNGASPSNQNTQSVFADQPDEPDIELGKLDPKPVPHRLYKNNDALENFVSSQKVPKEFTWLISTSNWNHYENHTKKTCVPAAAAYLIQNWTTHLSRPPRQISTEAVLLGLRQAAPDHNPNNGCRIADFLECWKNSGFEGHRIADSVSISQIKNPDTLRLITYYFGGCLIGLQMPLSAKKQTHWTYPTANPYLDKQKWGGHCVCVLGYNQNEFFAISAGEQISFTVDFFKQYNDELFAVLSESDWATAAKASPTQPGKFISDLQSIAKALT